MRQWLEQQRAAVLPKSPFGQAVQYALNHWDALTLFLRKAGAPLDNNLAEQMLKRAILHRKGSMFYKTVKGAEVGDIYMSLIHTCRLCDVNPFEYLRDVLGRISATPVSQLAELLPGKWKPTPVAPT